MIRQALDLGNVTPLNRTQIEHFAHVAGRFNSRILFEHKNRTINGKSMLGILSMGATNHDPVILTVEGEDEQEAFEAMKKMLDNGVAPPKNAADALNLMQIVKARYREILGDDLAGIYLHGSLPSGCFQWDVSDIDFLTVVRREPETEKKMALAETLRAMAEEAPPKGFEMSVVLEAPCREMPYPMPFVMHYSAGHEQTYAKDPRAFCESMRGTDPDLTAHVLNLHAHGVALLGPDIPRMFGQVKREDALSAIRYDAQDAQNPENLHENPTYHVLNLCRAVAFCRENRAMSKKEGGQWALFHLPTSCQRVVQAALNAYETGLDMFYDRGEAENFCALVWEEIRDAK